MHDVECVKARYRRFADSECKGYSDHYFELAHAVADDDWLVHFIAQMPVIQPNLFLASLQFLTGPHDMPRSGDEARRFVQARREDVEHLMHTRRTQTNEPGRCATLLPALPQGPVALLEVGAAAGLCLLLDAYAYDYGDVHLGSNSSPVRLHCSVKESPPIPQTMPEISWRAGLDINPLDVHDENDRRWLFACVWPEHAERRERLAAAITIAQSHDVPLHRGDVISELPSLLAEAPGDATLVIFHSAVLVYVSEEERRRFADILAEASNERDIVWISNEAKSVVLEISALAPPVEQRRFLLGRTSFTAGRRRDELLAVAHPHGAELDWLPRKEGANHVG